MVRDGVQEMTTLFHVTAVLHSSSLATLNANLTRLPQTQQVHRAKLALLHGSAGWWRGLGGVGGAPRS
jgi:hypothetical protein